MFVLFFNEVHMNPIYCQDSGWGRGVEEESIELGVLRLMSNMQSFLGLLLTLALFFLEAPALFLLITNNPFAELPDLDVPTSHVGTRFKHRC